MSYLMVIELYKKGTLNYVILQRVSQESLMSEQEECHKVQNLDVFLCYFFHLRQFCSSF